MSAKDKTTQDETLDDCLNRVQMSLKIISNCPIEFESFGDALLADPRFCEIMEDLRDLRPSITEVR